MIVWVAWLADRDGSGSIASSYYDKNSTATGGTLLVLGIGKTKAQLKAINLDTPDNLAACEAAGGTWDAANTDPCTSGNLTGWNAFNWEFQAGFYPTLKSYKVDSSNAQIAGTLLCGQLPEADFVQCAMP